MIFHLVSFFNVRSKTFAIHLASLNSQHKLSKYHQCYLELDKRMNILKLLFLTLLIVFAAAILTTPARPGCPVVVNPMQNFSLGRFAGKWYEIQKYSSQFDGQKCVSVNFGSIRGVNRTTVTINYSQKVGTTFSSIDQNATARPQMHSVWTMRYNRSINCEYKI